LDIEYTKNVGLLVT